MLQACASSIHRLRSTSEYSRYANGRALSARSAPMPSEVDEAGRFGHAAAPLGGQEAGQVLHTLPIGDVSVRSVVGSSPGPARRDTGLCPISSGMRHSEATKVDMIARHCRMRFAEGSLSTLNISGRSCRMCSVWSLTVSDADYMILERRPKIRHWLTENVDKCGLCQSFLEKGSQHDRPNRDEFTTYGQVCSQTPADRRRQPPVASGF